MINVALIFIRHNDSGDCDGSGDGSHGIDGNWNDADQSDSVGHTGRSVYDYDDTIFIAVIIMIIVIMITVLGWWCYL